MLRKETKGDQKEGLVAPVRWKSVCKDECVEGTIEALETGVVVVLGLSTFWERKGNGIIKRV